MKCPFAKCGAVWTPRVEKPVQCPRCKRVLPSKRGVGDGGADNVRASGSDAGGSAGGTGNRATVPVVQKAKSSAKQLRALPAVRGELAGGGDAPARLPEYGPQDSPNTRCPHGKLNSAYCRATGGGC